MTPAQVQKSLLERIAASGLSAADAKKLKLKAMVVEPTDIAIPGPGFVLPHFDIFGKMLEFYRYRYLETVLYKGKPIRYSQPAGIPPEAYYSPLFPWQKYLKENTGENRVLLVTEGELKAACGTKFGLPVIGLGGVWNFKSKKPGLIPGLRQIEWADATVYIVYDSDAISNYQVIQAENALAQLLLEEKAKVYIVRLPALDRNKKTGLDDYLIAEGRESFDKLLVTTEPWTVSRQLHELNEEVVYVRDPGLILRIDTLQRISARAFVDHEYSNRTSTIETVTAKGAVKGKVVSAPKAWLAWPHRAEVEKITYRPGGERITEARELNIWAGWGVEPRKGDVRPWAELLDHLFTGGNLEHRRWFEQWLAYPLQYPGKKQFVAVVFWSHANSTGKSTIGYTMKRIYGGNFAEIGDRELFGHFNEWAENKQFVMGDEITGGGERKKDSANRMKSLITQESLRVNPKFIPAYSVPDCINYYFTSNHPDAFYIEESERRYFVHEIIAPPKPQDWWDRYYQWLANDGAAALFHHLLNLDLIGFSPTAHAPETAAKHEMREASSGELRIWVSKLRTCPQDVLPAFRKDAIVWTASALAGAYNIQHEKHTTDTYMGRALKVARFEKVPRNDPKNDKVQGLVIGDGVTVSRSVWYVGPLPVPERLKTIAGVKEQYQNDHKPMPSKGVKP